MDGVDAEGTLKFSWAQMDGKALDNVKTWLSNGVTGNSILVGEGERGGWIWELRRKRVEWAGARWFADVDGSDYIRPLQY